MQTPHRASLCGILPAEYEISDMESENISSGRILLHIQCPHTLTHLASSCCTCLASSYSYISNSSYSHIFSVLILLHI
jgi:hypothetical protein